MDVDIGDYGEFWMVNIVLDCGILMVNLIQVVGILFLWIEDLLKKIFTNLKLFKKKTLKKLI